MTSPTHDFLVQKARTWVLGANRCSIALAEPWSMGREHPDAIGWNWRGWSILVECKTSRSDFNADKRKRKKWWSKDGYPGFGQERYYLAPKGVLTERDAWGDWGILELRKTRIYMLVKAGRSEVVARKMGTGPHGWPTTVKVFAEFDDAVRLAEWDVLYPAILNNKFGDIGSTGDPRRWLP